MKNKRIGRADRTELIRKKPCDYTHGLFVWKNVFKSHWSGDED